MIKIDELKSLIARFADKKILVIGDFYLDAYWYIDKTRSTLSLETPWHNNPVVDQRYSPGAAGTITNNLNALGVGTVYTIGVIGNDGFGQTLSDLLNHSGCITDFMITASNCVTPTYLKPIHRGYEDIEREGPRFDIENQTAMSENIEQEILNGIKECIPRVDGIIIGDQMPYENFGVITERIRDELCNLAQSYPEKVFLADSRNRIHRYKHVIIKPNRLEAQRAIDMQWHGKTVDIESTKQCAIKLALQTQNTVFITLGKAGILVCQNGQLRHIPGLPIDEKIDPVGAGDSVSAGIVPTLCCFGKDRAVEAAYFGNLVASITITKIGTTGTASPEEILERYMEINECI